jgi:hypothetical protein
MEMEFLKALDYQLQISVSEYSAWMKRLQQFQIQRYLARLTLSDSNGADRQNPST